MVHKRYTFNSIKANMCLSAHYHNIEFLVALKPQEYSICRPLLCSFEFPNICLFALSETKHSLHDNNLYNIGPHFRMELSEALEQSDPDNLSKVLTKTGEEVNLAHVETGDTALITASGKGRLDQVRLLLSKGADVTVRDVTGGSAVHAAASRDQVDILEELHKHGADLNAINRGGLSGLHLAVKKGFILSTKTLLRLGALPNICDVTWHRTPLYDAVKLGNFRLGE